MSYIDMDAWALSEEIADLKRENAALKAKVEVVVKNYEDYKAENAALTSQLANCAGYIASVRTDRRGSFDGEIYALQTLEWAEGAIEVAKKANSLLESIDAARKEAQP